MYPSATVVGLDTTADLVREVLQGQDCAAAVMSRAEWEEIEGQRDYNPGCPAGSKQPRLRRSGDALIELEAGFTGARLLPAAQQPGAACRSRLLSPHCMSNLSGRASRRRRACPVGGEHL
jgi:hypothetical protein